MRRRIFFSAGVAALVMVALRAGAWGGEADSGRELYLRYCSACHGEDGGGKGPVASVLKMPPANLTLLKQKNKGTFPLARVMCSIDGRRKIPAHGNSVMPVWGEVFKKEVEGDKYPELTTLLKVRVIAEYISTLQR
jgi:mono/diheme cytochrome c family protein